MCGLVKGLFPSSDAVGEIGARDGSLATLIYIHKGVAYSCHSWLSQHQSDAQFPVVPLQDIIVPTAKFGKVLAAHGITLCGKYAMQNLVGKQVGGEKREIAQAAVKAVQTRLRRHKVKCAAMLSNGIAVRFHKCWTHGVVAVEKQHPIAFCLGKSAVACGRCRVMRLLSHHHLKSVSRMLSLKFLQHTQRIVGTVIVNQHHLKWAVGLRQHRSECGFHLLGAVVNRYDDGKKHCVNLFLLQI